MNSPVGHESSFILKINGISIQIGSVQLNSADSKSIIINFSHPIMNDDKVTIQYAGHGLDANDGGTLQSFGPEEVYYLTDGK